MARSRRPPPIVTACAYTSSSLALLAIDWPAGADHPDFLGFVIQHKPGFAAAPGPSASVKPARPIESAADPAAERQSEAPRKAQDPSGAGVE